MAKKEEVLTPEELEILEGAEQQSTGDVTPYEFTETKQLEVAYPLLDVVNKNFIKLFQQSLFSLLRRPIKIELKQTETISFKHFMSEFSLPTYFSYLQMPPLKGTAAIALHPTLVYGLVNNYFGGGVVLEFKSVHDDFTSLEKRVIQTFSESLYEQLAVAWADVLPVQVKTKGDDINPLLVHIVPDDELVVVSKFNLIISEGEEQEVGEFYITMPYAMLQPIREGLDNVKKLGQKKDSLGADLAKVIPDVPIELVGDFAQVDITIGELLNLSPGDFIPFEQDQVAILKAEDEPKYVVSIGVYQGQYAAKIIEKITLDGE